MIVPAEDDERLPRAAAGLARELDDSLAGFHLTIGRSRRAADPVDLYRAGNEARLAVNVGEAEGRPLLAFEDTGAYRLLLPAMSEDPGELRALLRGDDRAARRLRRAVRDRAGRRRSRPTSTTTATSPRPPNSSSPTATRSATGSSACASSAATTSPPPRAARSSASASRRCACSASPPPAARRWSPAPKGGKVPRGVGGLAPRVAALGEDSNPLFLDQNQACWPVTPPRIGLRA